jgi:hypothetical protein
MPHPQIKPEHDTLLKFVGTRVADAILGNHRYGGHILKVNTVPDEAADDDNHGFFRIAYVTFNADEIETLSLTPSGQINKLHLKK